MKSNLSIIDADSIIYLIGSKYKLARVRASALNSVDEFIMSILENTYAKHYIGTFGKINGGKNFRYDVAKTSPYKGTRGDKEDWFKYWEPIMKNHMEKVWGFIPAEYVEADDICTFYGTKYKDDPKFGKVFICGVDKDLKQLGDVWHYNYRTHQSKFISEVEGDKFLYQQSVEGDSADNIPGVPGVGEITATELFKNVTGTVLKSYAISIFDEYINEIIPKNKEKAALNNYLKAYKIQHQIKRYTKSTKAAAMITFNAGGIFKPPAGYSTKLFEEMYALVYMLRTEEEIKVHWKDFIAIEPVKEKYMDWDKIDKNKELIDFGMEDEDFSDDITFLDDSDLEGL